MITSPTNIVVKHNWIEQSSLGGIVVEKKWTNLI